MKPQTKKFFQIPQTAQAIKDLLNKTEEPRNIKELINERAKPKKS